MKSITIKSFTRDTGRLIALILLTCLTALSETDAQPVSLHPANPHYLVFKGKPLVLITSAEHYGAVLNSDFDYVKYLNALAKDGLNYTRIFTGSYVEIPGSFNIKFNTLAPDAGKFLAPWKRTNEQGLFGEEKKFDLDNFNPEYFERLKDFVKEASDRDIIVEVTLFCSTYQDSYWTRNPFNPGNNINNTGLSDRKKSNTTGNGALMKYQAALVEKIVKELNSFDNVFFEIQNEPWADNGIKVMRMLKTLDPQGMNWAKWAEEGSKESLDWHRKIASIISSTEQDLPKKHLIAQNYTNFKHSLAEVDPAVSILNFHYVWPEAVHMNYGWNRPVNFDESGFDGSSDSTYLRQAWQFIMAGGAIFNNLDYSFYVGMEDGSGKNTAPGGGSSNFRKQLSYLSAFINSFDFIRMSPDLNVVYHAPGMEWYAISEKGKQYGIVLHGINTGRTVVNLPKGNYNYTFISPYSGEKLSEGKIRDIGSPVTLQIPENTDLIALKIIRY